MSALPRALAPSPTPACRVADDALALDRAAFAEWWHLVDWRLHARGAAERLFARAFAAGLATGQAQHITVLSFDPGRPAHYGRRDS